MYMNNTYTYTIFNKVLNEVVYVGKSINPKNRWKVHKSCARSIGKTNEKFTVKKIHHHMNEFGIENFVFSIVANYDCEGQLQEQIKPRCCMKYERIR